ncbi:MAG: hypothetical protein R3F41_00730 [Gammaproteobacteria bacterium]|nr:hypothetical protein [Pseudomonadales bacterium]
MKSNRQSLRNRIHTALVVITATSAQLSLAAQEPVAAEAGAGFWGVVIGVFVSLVAFSVAYLCYFAVRLWAGYWRALALAPLAVLGIWLALLLLGILTGMAPRALWTVEILFWAMATTIYLVTLFTARRAFEKADAATGGDSNF